MASERAIKAAAEAQLLHKGILDAWAKAQSVERVVELRNELTRIRRAYTTSELAALGVAEPMNLDPLDPDHALVLAVRGDMQDTERRMEAERVQRSDQFGGKSDLGFNIKLPDLPKVDLTLVAIAIAAVALALFFSSRK